MGYRDLADEVGVKTSRIHYCFPAKDDMAIAFVKRYRDGFKPALAKISTDGADPNLVFKRYVDLFVETVRGRTVCLLLRFITILLS